MTNLIQVSRNYRMIGDVPYAVIEKMLAEHHSPMLETGRETHLVASPHSALFWAQAWLENKWETTGIIIQPEDHNPMSLRPWLDDPRGMPDGATRLITASDGGQFLAFESDADCAREWRRRLVDDPDYKGGVYAETRTLDEMLAVYAPSGDVHPVTGVDNADIGYGGAVRTMLARFDLAENDYPPFNPSPD